MFTKEEVRIRLGIDSEAVGKQAGLVGHSIESSLKKTAKGINKLIGFNLVSIAQNLLSEIGPAIEKFWENFYGTSPEQNRKYEEAMNRMHALRKEVLASRKAIDDAYSSRQYKNADNLGKEAILEGDIALKKEDVQVALQKYQAMKLAHASVEKIAAAEKEYNAQLKMQLDLEDKLTELRDKFNLDESRASLQRRIHQRPRPRIYGHENRMGTQRYAALRRS